MQAAQPDSTPMKPTFIHLFRQCLPWLFWTVSATPLFILMGLGLFTRYLADDYSTSGILKLQGFWGAQTYWYAAWSGCFSYNFFISLIEIAGVAIVPWLPMTAIFLLIVSMIVSVRKLFTAMGIELGLGWIALLSNIILFGTIKSFHDFQQVIFWQTGIMSYQVNLILFSLEATMFLERFILSPSKTRLKREYLLWYLVFFISGGFAETWVVMQISLLGLAFICIMFTRLPNKKEILLMLGGGFIVSWLALLVMAYAPGNMNRNTIMAGLSVQLLVSSLIRAFWDVPQFLLEWSHDNTLLVVMLLTSGLAVGLFTKSDSKRASCHIGLGALLFLNIYIVMWAGFVPQFAVMGIRPVDRALFMPMFLLLWAYVLFGVFLGAGLRVMIKPVIRVAAQAGLLLALAYMLFLLPVRFALTYYNLAAPLSMYALHWDVRDSYLRQVAASGQTKVVVESLRRNPDLHAIQSTFWIEGDLQDLPNHWINSVAANYYGLKSITLKYPVKSSP